MLRGGVKARKPSPSCTPFDCSFHSQPLSPHAGTAFGRWLHQKAPPSRSPFDRSLTLTATNAGWNMVVLLRYRLQYSLFRPILPSLYRPPDALGSNPPPAGTAFGRWLCKPKGSTACGGAGTAIAVTEGEHPVGTAFGWWLHKPKGSTACGGAGTAIAVTEGE